MLVIGDGELADYLTNYTNTLGISNRIKFLGFQKNPYKFIAKAKALVLFSSYEGMPNVLIEAMYCKTIVIASDFLGVEDLIVHNQHGFIVPRTDIKGLSETMKKAINDNSEIEYIKASAFQRVMDLNEQSIKQYKSLVEC
jgi:N-acetylgalactosamine-N,N'-diacetylbacillosaminyl-diphospho-undecaprenol 4-alpha-N-acetylgalactosaminyltransferase